MKLQTVLLSAGAVAGAIVWAMVRGTSHDPGLFVSVVAGPWISIGCYSIVRGELTLGGRGGKSPRTYTGTIARFLGIMIVAGGVAFFVTMARL